MNKSDNELMAEFAECSLDAYKIIFMRYKNKLFNFVINAYPLDRMTAEEIVQKSLIKVYENKYTYKPTFQFSTWIYTIAKNLSVNELKRKKALAIEDEDYPVKEQITTAIESNEEIAYLIAAINRLDYKYREAIHLRFFEEMNYEEISTITGEKIGTLKSHVSRGLRKLNELMEKKQENEKSV